jgi:hypothetical protein
MCMNRLVTVAVTAAGALALVGGETMGAAAPAGATGPGGNSAYGASAPAGPVTSPPLALATASGPTMVTWRHLNIADTLSSGLTQDNAGAITAFSRVHSVSAGMSGDGIDVSLAAGQVESTCRSDTQTASANMVSGVLTVNGAITHLPQQPRVNQTFPLLGGDAGTMTLNARAAAPGGGVEVQAVHIHFTGTEPAGDLYLGVSVCTSPGTLGNTVTVNSPGGQTTDVDETIEPLPIVATDSDPGQTLTYSATGLPPGLSINPATGVITGMPTTDDSPYTVTVTVTDTTGASGSTTFQWVIDPDCGC